MTKKCSQCKISKELNCFYLRSNVSDGRTSHCKECAKNKQKQWNLKNYEKIKKHNLVYAAKNKEKAKENAKLWKTNNPDKVKKWNEANGKKALDKYRSSPHGKIKIQEYSKSISTKAEMVEYRRNYYLANKEKYRNRDKKWAKENKGKIAHKASVRRSKMQMATFKHLSEEIKKIYTNCPAGYQVDHIIPLNNPMVCGLHVPWNLQYLTTKENLKKSNKCKELENAQ